MKRKIICLWIILSLLITGINSKKVLAETDNSVTQKDEKIFKQEIVLTFRVIDLK